MSLQRAHIKVLDHAGDLPQFLEVMFNPTEYRLRSAVRLAETALPGLDAPVVQFAHGESSTLAMELLLDTTDSDFFSKVAQRKEIAEEMGAAYTAEGIITLAGSRLYTSMADTDEVVEEALEGFARVLGSVEGVG